jgi:glycosyltransferase involved in cell wall biosynthesis
MAAPKVALVHDWLTGMRGGEKVLDAICELYPEAPLYCLVHVRGAVSARIEGRRIFTSFAQRLPGAHRLYRQYLPLFPAAIELFDLDGYDLVISTSHCAAKAVVPRGGAVHVDYCHSPMRYAWDQFEEYFGADQVGGFRNRLLRPVMARLARWDRATAGRVDRFVANSHYVAGRIRRYYNRGSTVVYPPVDTAFYRPPSDYRPSRSRFLIVSALVPYKRLDVAIDACRRVRVPLSIVGTGPERARLERPAGPDVEFLGWRNDEDIRALYQQSRAVLLPGVEDFGMVPVEAQACGCPVVAFDEGGAQETVIDGETGVLVKDRAVEAFAEGLTRVSALPLDPDRLRQHALTFAKDRFVTGFQAVVQESLAPLPSAARENEYENQNAARRTPPLPPAARENENENENAARRTPPRPPAARENKQ